MRPIDSAYDRNAGAAAIALLDALRLAHTVDFADRDVIVDGETLEANAFDAAAMAWDGTADGLEDLGWEAAAEALRDAEEAT